MSGSSTAAATGGAHADVALEEVALRALALQPQPITISRLRASLPPPLRGTPASFRAQLDSLASRSRVWLYASGSKSPPLVWDRAPEVLAETVIVACLKKPLSLADIEKKTRAKLKRLSVTERRNAIDRLLASGRLFRWPRQPRARTEKLGLQPPDPREYVASALKALATAVAQATAAFADAGISPDTTHAAILAAVQEQDWARGVGRSMSLGPSVASDDEGMLAIVAERMALIDPRSRGGAPVLISDLRPALDFLFPVAAAFDAALVQLERKGRVSLLRYDPALAARPLPPSSLVTDGRISYSGVSLR
jgi:hypothetical protein